MTRAATLLLLLVIWVPAWGAGGDARKDLKQVKSEIKKKEKLVQISKKIEKQVSGELALIDRGLREKEADHRRLSAELQHLDQGIEQTRRQTDTTRSEVDRKQQEIRNRLVALYKSGDTGPVRIFFSSGSFPQMLESLRYMEALLENDRKMIDDYGARIRALGQLTARLEDDARKKEKLRTGIEAKKREIEVEKRRKAEYLAKVRQDKASYEASLKELAANASRLQAMVQQLEVKSRTRYRKQPAPRPGTRVVTKETAPPASRPSPTSPSGFGGRKRQLAIPVQGKVIQGFGRQRHPEFNTYTDSHGLTIAAAAGADIHAVDGGTVIFANYFKGYGNMVIIDPGDGFFSVYAHASHIARKEGSSVARNEVIASVGDLDSSRGPLLYFEIRSQGKPVDPAPWFR